MKIVDTFWFGQVGFVKVDNGFEKKVYVGVAQGVNEQHDSEFIAKFGYPVPTVLLTQFLEDDKYRSEYTE